MKNILKKIGEYLLKDEINQLKEELKSLSQRQDQLIYGNKNLLSSEHDKSSKGLKTIFTNQEPNEFSDIFVEANKRIIKVVENKYDDPIIKIKTK